MHGNTCAVLSRDNQTGCEGLGAQLRQGWNDKISSVKNQHGSRAVLKQHDDGSGKVVNVAASKSVSSLPGFNDQASVVLCVQ